MYCVYSHVGWTFDFKLFEMPYIVACMKLLHTTQKVICYTIKTHIEEPTFFEIWQSRFLYGVVTGNLGYEGFYNYPKNKLGFGL